jgi:hypothetical protein
MQHALRIDMVGELHRVVNVADASKARICTLAPRVFAKPATSALSMRGVTGHIASAVRPFSGTLARPACVQSRRVLSLKAR